MNLGKWLIVVGLLICIIGVGGVFLGYNDSDWGEKSNTMYDYGEMPMVMNGGFRGMSGFSHMFTSEDGGKYFQNYYENGEWHKTEMDLESFRPCFSLEE